MKTITPFKRLDRYALKEARFKTIEEAQAYIRENGTPDYLAIANILYTMEEYDNDGRYIDYHNRRTGNTLKVYTSDRYKLGFSDAQLELLENYGFFRNDINFAD